MKINQNHLKRECKLIKKYNINIFKKKIKILKIKKQKIYLKTVLMI
jgi:hypothetical protein